MTFVSGLALRAWLVSIVALVIIAGAADRECTFIASYKELALGGQANIIPTDLTNVAIDMLQRFWLQHHPQTRQNKQTQDVMLCLHPTWRLSSFCKSNNNSIVDNNNFCCPCWWVTPDILLPWGVCRERERERKKERWGSERGSVAYALILWPNHHKLISVMRTSNQTGICFHGCCCTQLISLPRSSSFPLFTRLSLLPHTTLW